MRSGSSKFFDPVGRRLAALFALILLAPTLVSAVLTVEAFREHTARVRLGVRQFAILAANAEDNLILESEKLLVTLAQEPPIRAAGQKATGRQSCVRILQEAIKTRPAYGYLILFDLGGSVLCKGDPKLPDVNVADREWFREVVRMRSMVLSGYIFSSIVEEPTIVAAHPVFTEDGRLVAVIALSIRLAWWETIERERGLPADAVVYVLDGGGKVLTGTGLPRGLSQDGLPEGPVLESVLARHLIDFDAVGRDGVARIYGVARLRRGEVVVLLGVPMTETVGFVVQDLRNRLFALSGMWLGVLLAIGIATRFFVTRWTDRLAATARALGRGDLSARTDVRGAPSEFKLLGETFAKMAKNTEARERELRDLVNQKQLMLKEIHHRIKNNLQTVTSLLNLHVRQVYSADARRALADVQARIRALALVHVHLYESEDTRVIELKPFISDLCRLLRDSSGVPPWRVGMAVDAPSRPVPMEMAMPLALLITELVTNSFKHAFPDGRKGTIRVQLATVENGDSTLVVADDGVGPSEPAASSSSDQTGPGVGIGRTLIQAFAKQLGGELEVSGAAGTTTTIRFNLNSAPSGKALAPEGQDDNAPQPAGQTPP